MTIGPAKLIRANEPWNPSSRRTADFTLEELREFVGGYVELLCPPSNAGAVLMVNEEGRLRDLPFNEIASAVFGQDFIVGDVLLCHKSQIR